MKSKLDDLLKTLKGFGYQDYTLSQNNGDINISFERTKDMSVSEEDKLKKEFNIKTFVDDDLIVVSYKA